MRHALIAALLLALAIPGCARAEPPRPLLWKVSDADNSLYLLGSFHLLREGDYPLAASTDAAFEDAETVVFELPPAEMGDPALGQAMAAAARIEGGGTLQSRLPADTWALLQAHAARRGMALEFLQAHEAWFVSLVISVTEMQRVGLDPALGLDKHFANRAVAAGKAVAGLETGAQQIAMFDGMDAAQQEQALDDVLSDLAALEQEINRMHALWRAGDAETLHAESAAKMKAEYPDLYERLNRGRNLAWLPRLQALLDDSREDDALVVVGAMHLLGEDGVVELLRAKGYAVERL